MKFSTEQKGETAKTRTQTQLRRPLFVPHVKPLASAIEYLLLTEICLMKC